MKANWFVLLLAIASIVFALMGDRRSYDNPVSTNFDPLRAVRIAVMRPFYQAVTALSATADW